MSDVCVICYIHNITGHFNITRVVTKVLCVLASALQCYRCTSSQPGCGKELNIRIQRWHTCPDTGPFGGENFCVKVIEKINGTSLFI